MHATVVAFVPLLFVLGGLLMYALCVNPKLQEIGRILFFCGALAFAMGMNTLGVRIRD